MAGIPAVAPGWFRKVFVAKDETQAQALLGPLIMPAGSAAAVALGIGQSDLGWFRKAADKIGLSISGTERSYWQLSSGILQCVVTSSGQIQITNESQTAAGSGPLGLITQATGTNKLNNQALVLKSLSAGRAVTMQMQDGSVNSYWSMLGNETYFRTEGGYHWETTGGAALLDLAAAVATFNQPVAFRSYAKASLPTATAGRLIHVSDEVGGAQLAYSDGSNWRRISDGAVVS